MFKGKKIFIFEDDDSIFDVMCIVLESEHYVVQRFDDSSDFIAQVIAHNPGLILMDIHYKQLRTESLIDQLRKNSKTVKVPVIISSADANLEKLVLKYKVSGYLKKPFDMIALINIVKNNIE